MIALKNIVLIGMSGVGKTTIGKALSKTLARELIDMDNVIVDKMGIDIKDIFSLYGESYFRNLENNLIMGICEKEDVIIATGGGVVLESTNMVRLKKKGIVIFLEASIDTIVNNLKGSTTVRPLLNDMEDIVSDAKELYNIRKSLYLSSADFIISIDNKSIDEIIYEILKKCVKINS